LYSSFSIRPKHLDPARSYSANEAIFTAHIYEPPLQYHYLKRPYELEALTARSLPKVELFNASHQRVSSTDDVAYTIYTIEIKPGIHYQPHPCFARSQGQYVYHNLDSEHVKRVDSIADFEQQATRELIADDYVYQIKRLAHPSLHSPILSLMTNYIDGLDSFANQLQDLQKNNEQLDIRNQKLSGVTVIDRYTYQIKTKGYYPQFIYWLAMQFFFSSAMGS
jgi:ABC-type transport system substrate-binding protein